MQRPRAAWLTKRVWGPRGALGTLRVSKPATSPAPRGGANRADQILNLSERFLNFQHHPGSLPGRTHFQRLVPTWKLT